MTRDEIYTKLSGYLEEMFEVPAEKITLSARLYEDLDLDSVDAVDLVVKLQELTGRKIKPDQFKTVRTVADVVDRVHDLFGQTT
jgi:acyl carrier protein